MNSKTIYKAIILVVVVGPLLATIYAMNLLWQRAVHPLDIVLLLSMYTITALGVTIGYHRMLTHRSFQPHPAIKFLFLVMGSMSLEGAAIEWASTHTKHHAQADKEGDPHSPVEGFFHAHIGWLFQDNTAPSEIYARHLLKDPVVMFVSKTFFLWVGLSLLIPFLLGGWTGLLWGGLVRIFLAHHVTWSVNSVCHTFGKREFETSDQSRNEWVVGLLGFGEGWLAISGAGQVHPTVLRSAGIDPERYAGLGVVWCDYDRDGRPDIYVANDSTPSSLYHNNGDETFTDVTAKAGVAGGGWSVSAGFFDFDNDGHLDLFVTRYMEWDTQHNKICGGQWKTYCPPGEFPAMSIARHRASAAASLADAAQPTPKRCSMSSAPRTGAASPSPSRVAAASVPLRAWSSRMRSSTSST